MEQSLIDEDYYDRHHRDERTGKLYSIEDPEMTKRIAEKYPDEYDEY